jgi:hypothetical protein
MKITLLKIWILSFILLVAMPIVAISQSFYTSINAGYGYNLSGLNNTSTMYLSSYKNKRGSGVPTEDFSLGEGMNLGISFGYNIAEHFGIEIGLAYLPERTFITKERYSETNYFEVYTSGDMFLINPSIVLSAGDEMFVPFLKLGVAFGIGSMEFSHKSSANINTLEASGGTPIGLTAAFGMEIKFYEQISCFAQVSTLTMSYFPANGEITRWVEYSGNILPKLTYRDKHLKFTNSYLSNDAPDPNPDPNKARAVSWKSFPYDYFGFNIGVKYRF